MIELNDIDLGSRLDFLEFVASDDAAKISQTFADDEKGYSYRTGDAKLHYAGDCQETLHSSVRRDAVIWTRSPHIVVGRSAVDFPIEQQSSIHGFLAVKIEDTATPEAVTAINAAFDNYDIQSGTDIEQHMLAALGEGTEASEKHIVTLTLVVNKIGSRKVDTNYFDALYKSLDNELYDVHLGPPYFSGGLGGPNDGIEVSDPEKPDVLKEKVKDELIRERCSHEQVSVDEFRIGRIPSIPEFKIEIRKKKVRIGRIRIRIWLPALCVRGTSLVAWAVIGYPKLSKQDFIDALESCGRRAALHALVVGVVFWSPAAAAGAFMTTFQDCMVYHLGGMATCISVKLDILKDKHEWHCSH